MPRRAPLFAGISLALLLTGNSRGGMDTVESKSAPALEMGGWNQPVAFTLEARSVEQTQAFGLHVVTPIFHKSASALLVEGYGYKGETKLALAGGGLIYRRTLSDHSSFEANAFFDQLRSEDGFSYPQFGAGVSFSPTKWLTLLANGYLPLRDKESKPHGFERWREVERRGPELVVSDYERELRAERAPMRGFDAEMEFHLPKPPRWIDPRLAIGYAYREADDRPEVYAGPLVRGELHFGKNWVAEVEWRDDAHGVGQEWRAGLKYQALFGGAPGPDEAGGDDRYRPADRFPWPTVARGVTEAKGKRGGVRVIEPGPQSPQSTDPNDCCPANTAPLTFD